MDFLIKKYKKELDEIFHTLRKHYYSSGDDLISLTNSARGLSKKNRNDLWRLIELSKSVLAEHTVQQEKEFSSLVKRLLNNLSLRLQPISYGYLFLIVAIACLCILLSLFESSYSSIVGAIILISLLVIGFRMLVSIIAITLLFIFRITVRRFLKPVKRPYSNRFEDGSFDRNFDSVDRESTDVKENEQPQGFNYQRSVPKFSSAEEAGLHGEMEIDFIIRTQTNERILTPISTENLILNGYNFEIDLLVPVDGVGLVLLEVKNFQGKLLCISDDEWVQVKYNGEKRSFKGATKQVSRTRKLLQKNLQEYGLDGWDIIPVVVLANADTEVIRLDDRLSPCYAEIVRKQEIVTWLHNLPVNSQVKVTPDDATKIHMSLLSIQKEFQGRGNTA